MKHPPSGYTLIEVLIAGALLAMGIAAAALLANSMVIQEEDNARVVRSINLHEQAARLFQLGLDYQTITNVLPEKCSTTPSQDGTVALGFTVATNNVPGAGWVEQAQCTMVYFVGEYSDIGAQYATNTVTVVRPVIR